MPDPKFVRSRPDLSVYLEPDVSFEGLTQQVEPYRESYPLPFAVFSEEFTLGATRPAHFSFNPGEKRYYVKGFMYFDGLPYYIHYNYQVNSSNLEARVACQISNSETYNTVEILHSERSERVWSLDTPDDRERLAVSVRAGRRHIIVFQGRGGQNRIMPVDLVYLRDPGLLEIQTEAMFLPQIMQDPTAFLNYVQSNPASAGHLKKRGGAVNGQVGLWNPVHKIDSDGTARDFQALTGAEKPYQTGYAEIHSV